MGVIPVLGLVDTAGSGQGWLKNWSSRSWLLTDLLGSGASGVLCAILYLAGLVGFVAAALALLGWVVPHDWWRTLARGY